jgi:hypothetical protein
MNEHEEKALVALNAAIDRDIKMIAQHPVRILDTINTLSNMINIRDYIEAKAAVPKKAPAKAKGDKK